MNKFTLFQTSTMTDEELDLYWAEIAQIINYPFFLQLMAPDSNFRFPNCQNCCYIVGFQTFP